MFAFILGFAACLVFVLILAWCCDSEKKEPIDPPVNSNDLAATILRNLAAVQMLQLHLNIASIDYRLAKDMIALQDEHHMVLIAVPVQEIEDAADEQMQEQAWERLKVALDAGSLTEWPDDGMSGDCVG